MQLMCIIFTAFYLDQGQQNAFLRNFFVQTVPTHPFKLKMTLDTVASLLKKVHVSENAGEESMTEDEEESHLPMKSPREVAEETRLQMLIK